MNSKKILGVIPARGGSKGIPNKNIIDVGGEPLIYYTIKAGSNSKMLTQCVVSTESDEIERVAKACGGDVPFKRPEDLSSDNAVSMPVMKHAIQFMEKKQKCKYDIVVMLQPTTPLRLAEDIDNSLILLEETKADAVISVVDVGANHPLRMKRVVDGRLINYIDQGYENMQPRQELPPVYIRNGAIYAVKRDVLMENDSWVGSDVRAYIMPTERSINIDAIQDLYLVNSYMNN
jgi:CMP-N,N'-diacetyllegionaminic acid synthase